MKTDEEDFLSEQLKKFAGSKSEFGTDHVEGAKKESENIFVSETEKEKDLPGSLNTRISDPSDIQKDTSATDAVREGMRMLILFKVLNIAFAGANTWLFNYYYKTKLFSAKDLMLEDEEMTEAGEFFKSSKFLKFLDVVPDEIWGFCYLEWMFIERAQELHEKHEQQNKEIK
jgi:hypothetical protein